MREWRLIESPPSDIFSAMALDRRLFDEFFQNLDALPLLRIYSVSEPGISVGRSWGRRLDSTGVIARPPPAKRRVGSATPLGGKVAEAIPLLRLLRPRLERRLAMTNVCIRPTGGGLVEHGRDLLYSVIAWRDSYDTFHSVRTSYLSFHEAIQEAFQTRGIETRLFRCDEAKSLGRGFRATDCFREPVATDLLYQGRKIAGGAQWRRARAFLHQGSVRLPKGIAFEELSVSVVRAFEKKFGIEFLKSAPIDERSPSRL